MKAEVPLAPPVPLPRRTRGLAATRVLTAAILALAFASAATAQEQERYTYFRSVEGTAELTSSDGSLAEAETNYPILVGDRLRLGEDGRADVLLADGTQVTVDAGTEVVFDDLAYSADGPAEGNALRLVEGRIFVASHGAWTGAHDTPVVDTQNARVYLQEDGAYVITAAAEGFTEVTVRYGFAEVVDQRGSSVARAGESLEVVGDEAPRAEVLAARGETELEAWARDQQVRYGGSDPSLEQPLESTATLAEQGDWIEIDSRRGWKPYVTVKTWRPYYNGRWAYTPRGLYWVSWDPWSPVVYHYGSWEYDLIHGWVWFPGYRWAPAHVYWYWGPSYAAWMPIGYYSRHYRGFYPGFGLRYGVYGWVGGSWDPFYDWTFCPIGFVGHRWSHRHFRDGRHFAGHGLLERGVLTNDTRFVDRRQWRRPELVHVALERGWRANHGDGNVELPDVNRFVDRPGQLPENVARQVLLKPNPTSRGFDERVAAVLTRDGRDPSASSSRGVARRELAPEAPASSPAAADRRLASRQNGNDSGRAARTVTTDRSGPSSSRGTVARDVNDGDRLRSTPSARGGVDRSAPGTAGAGRAVVPRTPSTGGERQPVTRSGESTPGATRQRITPPTDPARRVLDGIRGRSRPTTSGVTTPSRPTVSRQPVAPRTSSTPSVQRPSNSARQPVARPSSTSGRQPVARPSSGSSVVRQPVPRSVTAPRSSGSSVSRQPVSRPSGAVRSQTPTRRPVTSSPPPRVQESSRGRTVSRAPVGRSSITRAPVSSRGSARTPVTRAPSASSRSVVRAPRTESSTPSRISRPSYAPRTHSAPTTRSAPSPRRPVSRATAPSAVRSGVSRHAAPSGYSSRPSASRPSVSSSVPARRPSSVGSAPSRGGGSRTAVSSRSSGRSSSSSSGTTRSGGGVRRATARPGSGGER